MKTGELCEGCGHFSEGYLNVKECPTCSNDVCNHCGKCSICGGNLCNHCGHMQVCAQCRLYHK